MKEGVDEKCYCGRDASFEQCCKPFLKNQQVPQSPEQLMRSRYTAYVLADADYIIKTTHPKTRYLYKKRDILAWAKESEWVRLEVIVAIANRVEFKAYFRDKNHVLHIHFEKSLFEEVEDKWFYLSGDFE